MPSAQAATLPTRSFKLSLCDYANLTGRNPQFVAANFDGAVYGGKYYNISQLKSINPNFRMIAYRNLLVTRASEQSKYSEAMFDHDPLTAQRLQINQLGETWYVMNPKSTEWRTFVMNDIKGYYSVGFDGVLLDDVWGDLLHPMHPKITSYSTASQWYSATTFRANMKSFISYIATQSSPRPTIINGLNEYPTFAEKEYLPAVQGAVMEGFVYNNMWGEYYATGDKWKTFMNAFMSSPTNKMIATICYGTTRDTMARMYSLGSFLLAKNDSSMFYYTPNGSVLSYFPEWRCKIGSPLKTATNIATYYNSTNKVYSRTFSNGRVFVNPNTTSTSPIQLGKTMYRVVVSGGNVPEIGGDGTMTTQAINTLTLAGHEGAILLNTSN